MHQTSNMVCAWAQNYIWIYNKKIDREKYQKISWIWQKKSCDSQDPREDYDEEKYINLNIDKMLEENWCHLVDKDQVLEAKEQDNRGLDTDDTHTMDSHRLQIIIVKEKRSSKNDQKKKW